MNIKNTTNYKDEKAQLSNLLENIDYHFIQVGLLRQALTHSSWANEARMPEAHNERLEFLGDAVLELCVSDSLYARFPHAREGELTRARAQLVNENTLATIAREIGLDKAILLGKGEEKQGGRERNAILCDALEAVLAAIYLDGGFQAARKCVDFVFKSHWPQDIGQKQTVDCKSLLQQVSQQLFKDFPVYAQIGSHGPEHEKIFEISVTLPDGRSFCASNSSCKKAEQDAAAYALAALEKKRP